MLLIVLGMAVPQKDPDEEKEPSWRITVNPSAELFGSQRLRQLIDRLYHQQKLLSANDAKQVLSALQAIDPSSDLLLPLLTVLSNATAYPANQILMRELRITERVAEMICSPRRGWSRSCRVMLLQCLANMAVSPENHPIVRCAIPHAVQRLSLNDEMEVVVALQALTNLSLNISKDQAVSGLLRLLDTDREEVLLRAVTWLLCTSSAVEALHLTYDKIACHNQDPFRNPSHTLYHSIYGPKGRQELEERARELAHHSNPDVCNKATRLLEILKNVGSFPFFVIPPFVTLGSQLNRL
ncbi:unnamed protein product [Nippostrongylus brasiliensis]|uniref:Arm_2 domain-containing protein n=1 Tax=Nippostrongylus brasiliensis TaxID=27835 RepID=A0A0N4XXD7_NIPBR|nr:unnamed protein product [Nippostrongylus brasiliensis]